MMEKLKTNIAVKIAAAALFALSFFVFCISGAGILLLDSEEIYQTDKKEAVRELYERVGEKYSIVALSGYEDGFKKPLLTDTNFRYGVVKAKDISKVDLSDPDSYLVHNFERMPEENRAWIYAHGIAEETSLAYGENLWDDFHIQNMGEVRYEDIEFSTDGWLYYDRMGEELYVRSDSSLFRVYASDIYTQTEVLYGISLSNAFLEEKNGKYTWDKDFQGIVLENEGNFIEADRIKIVDSAGLAKAGKEYGGDYEVESIVDDHIYVSKSTKVPVENYYVVAYVQEPLKGEQSFFKGDMFVQAKLLIDFLYRIRYALIWLLFGSFALLAASFVFLMCAAGRRKNQEGVCRRFADFIPLDLYFGAVCIAELIFIAMFGSIFSVDFTRNWFRVSVWIALIFLAAAGVLTALMFCMSFAVNVKLGGWWRRTAVYIIYKKCGKFVKTCFRAAVKAMKAFWRSLSLLWKAWALLGAAAVFELFLICATAYEPEAMVIYWFFKTLLLCPVIIYLLLQMNRLQKGARKIAEGRMDYQVDTGRMFSELKKHGEYLNDIGNGMNRAVSERMKSERFKTELITNVSHDIKTPLTSIINYVDLLQKEQTDNPAAREYLDVLSRQSARLKKLIEDLIEASKASSGSLGVTWEQCDMGVMLVQTAGEFEEKLMANEVTLQMKKPERDIFIKADSRHLWRVFDNLMNNICKYAQPSTRAYVDIQEEGGRIEVTFRNISRNQLNISSDELMERFVRGDSSRNSEGSGLGLSIAKSLTELMGGTFQLVIDGDLFKVVLGFPAA